MRRKSCRISAGEPSFFYLMLANGCFRRSASTRHPNASRTLREIGRDYLAKASIVESMLEAQPLEVRRAPALFFAD
jgi:hypothetical protein